MFKKKFRLPPNGLKAEKSFVSPFYVLKVAQNDRPGPRIGIVVSKSVSKKAVVRNKIKRKIRAYLEENIKNNDGRDFLFIFKKEPEDYEEVYKQIEKDL